MQRTYLRAFRLNESEVEELRELVKHYGADNYSMAIRRAIREVLDNGS